MLLSLVLLPYRAGGVIRTRAVEASPFFLFVAANLLVGATAADANDCPKGAMAIADGKSGRRPKTAASAPVSAGRRGPLPFWGMKLEIKPDPLAARRGCLVLSFLFSPRSESDGSRTPRWAVRLCIVLVASRKPPTGSTCRRAGDIAGSSVCRWRRRGSDQKKVYVVAVHARWSGASSPCDTQPLPAVVGPPLRRKSHEAERHAVGMCMQRRLGALPSTEQRP